jgi:hypothetical protein
MNKVYELSEVTTDHLGCWIDGSLMSSKEFDIQIVETAIHFGWDINVEDWKELKNQLDEDYGYEVLEDLYFVGEDAFNYLSAGVPDGYFFYILDQMLFLTHEDFELTK